MENNSFDIWCAVATGKIRYRPDRRAVSQELMDHLEDHRDMLMEQGMDEQAASTAALEAMGKAHELAPQLAAVHRPFWGYALLTGKVLLVILLCLSILPIADYLGALRLSDTANHRDFAVYDAASYGGDSGRTLLHLSQPEVSFTSDGSTFTLTDAAVFTATKTDGSTGDPQLCVRILQTGLLPAKEHEEYRAAFYLPISTQFHAVDSLGNVYPCYAEWQDDDRNYLYADGVQSGIFSYTHECWINHFPAEAEWVELRYKRDGRSYSLRIDLTGGDGT